MALTLSGTNGVVGAGFTVDASGVSVTAGVGTFSSLQGSGANLTALPAANLTGTLPALNAASLTQIPAANIVGLCTVGFGNVNGAFGNVRITRVGQGSLNGVDAYTYTSMPTGIVEFSYQWYGASLVNNTSMLFRIGHDGATKNFWILCRTSRNW